MSNSPVDQVETEAKKVLTELSKEQLVELVAKIVAKDYIETKYQQGRWLSIEQQIENLKSLVDKVLSDEYHRDLDSDMFDITTG